MTQQKRGWYASGKERKPGNLFKYALIILVGVVFAVVAIYNLTASMVPGGGNPNIGAAILWGFIWALGTAVVGLIVWFIYKALVLDRQK
jgi:hypothetical protein